MILDFLSSEGRPIPNIGNPELYTLFASKRDPNLEFRDNMELLYLGMSTKRVTERLTGNHTQHRRLINNIFNQEIDSYLLKSFTDIHWVYGTIEGDYNKTCKGSLSGKIIFKK